MDSPLLYFSIGLTLCFAFVNGFHDGGNVIATLVCSRSMKPFRALLLAAIGEFVGPLILGTAVARTVATSILKPDMLEQLSSVSLELMVISAVGGAIAWKLPTWYLGLPSSGSHALIGGLVGAGMVGMGAESVSVDKVVVAVIIPLLVSPILGIIFGFVVFGVIRVLCSRAHRGIGRFFESLQRPTVFFLAACHGSNDAQKSMGVIAIILASQVGEMHGELPLPMWVIVSCAASLALGLTAGGWRIVKTVGYRICRMEPVHSFASQFSSILIILGASIMGGPVSTTQVVASSVMGVGASRRLGGVRWSAAAHIAYAWFLTFPVCAGISAGALWGLKRILAV
ncbi:MAG: inorganic phosphate transporter [Desulfomonile tiedjei]|uniref:Inorganic phosphate transporter n=1 Tax=Desulfomonile tiedjei TaxID=2358 RepID=A0A9D6Z485_9BACT|nr:inorganic phosphate transporter [Desulfomonile tiedjei]